MLLGSLFGCGDHTQQGSFAVYGYKNRTPLPLSPQFAT